MPKSPFLVLALLLAAGCARHTIPPVVLINQTRIGPAEDFGPGITGVQFNGINFDLASPAHVIVLRLTNSAGVEPVRPLRSRDKSQLLQGDYLATAPNFSRSNYAAQAAQRAAYVSGVCGSPYEQDTSHPIPAGADTSRRAAPRSNALAQRRYQDCVRREREANSQTEGPAPFTQPHVDDVGYWLLIVSDAPTTAGELAARLRLLGLPNTSLVDLVRALPEALVGSRTAHWAAYYVAFVGPSTR
jgi:hypothetical protein